MRASQRLPAPLAVAIVCGATAVHGCGGGAHRHHAVLQIVAYQPPVHRIGDDEADQQCHRMPLQLEITDLESSDHIGALNAAEHFPLMQERFPSWFGASDPCRIEYWHVHDIDRMAPEEALPLITEQLQGLMKRLSSKNPEPPYKPSLM